MNGEKSYGATDTLICIQDLWRVSRFDVHKVLTIFTEIKVILKSPLVVVAANQLHKQWNFLFVTN